MLRGGLLQRVVQGGDVGAVDMRVCLRELVNERGLGLSGLRRKLGVLERQLLRDGILVQSLPVTLNEEAKDHNDGACEAAKVLK